MNAPVIQTRFHDANPIAQLNRDALHKAGVLAVSIVGGPGCGKTSLIAETIEKLRPEVRVGVIACDLSTHCDADRISSVSDQVVQVNTGESGVVDASHIRDALRWLKVDELDLLLIENVGTLVLSHIPDVGQDASAVMFSVAGGDDKADKHANLVQAADVVLLNKTDLLPSVAFDVERLRMDVHRIKAGVPLIELSALRGHGLDGWIQWLQSKAPLRNGKPSHWFG